VNAKASTAFKRGQEFIRQFKQKKEPVDRIRVYNTEAHFCHHSSKMLKSYLLPSSLLTKIHRTTKAHLQFLDKDTSNSNYRD